MAALPQTAYAAPGLTDAQLEAMSQERLNEQPHRDWGKPVPVDPHAAGPHLSPLPQPAMCLSTSSDSEEIHAAPTADSPVIGIAPGRVAATGTLSNGWRLVLFTARKPGWVPAAHIVPYHPDFAGGPKTCTVMGVEPNGTIAYHVQ